ncbi:MAG TPA: type II toxin-antitoxin system RelE/ParE family toxin [Acidobacteriaceae bacterium]|nr:type II toxin-antitoxin system RelE/ParE family toxin [Acidobacteriaceae bacterium]
MGRFRVSTSAFRDLDEIWSYIASDNPAAADRIIGQLHEAIRWLARYPAAGHRRSDIGERPLLFWAEGRYEIVYRVFDDFIEVDAVLHGSRDIPAVLRGREEDHAE